MSASAMATKPAAKAATPAIERLVVGLLTAFVFTIPFEEIVTIPTVGSITRLLGFAVIAVGLVALVRGSSVVLKRPMVFHAVALAFVVWNLATFFWSYEPSATVRQFVVYGQLFAFAWLMGEHARSHARLATLMQAFVLGNYVTFGLTVFAVFVQGNAFRDLGRFNANEVAIVAALAIPMAMALLAVPTAGWRRWVNAAYPIVALSLIVLSASRGGLIVGVVALAAVPFAFARANALVRTGAFVVLVAVGAAGFEVVPRAFPELQANLERLASTGDELTGGTLTGRTEIWGATLATFAESPILGVGAGAPRYALRETDLARTVAVHNAYLSIAAGGGLIALALFLSLFGLAAASAWFAPSQVRPFLLVLVLALLVALLPANAEARKYTWFALTLLACYRPLVLSHRVAVRAPAGGAVSRS